ncbi:hypothetical protein LGQ03_04660 [Loktanella sp. TSTF-M6]|uniref:Protease inhibitor Inh n=1 Tax=Loktanella gaetbuli TaxID=2881335 RepID=A0ABS8BRZ7_9RHOB|nr:hypothetical protein [Loktanella gaetbuli]MCB5198522.1 hypothetical protein [Loktanella gaetbuli]
MRTAAALLCVLTAPALADPMTGPEFDAYATGRTLSFAAPDGTVFGIEKYLPDQRVRWSAAPGMCVDGSWFASGGAICFVYDGDPIPKCWDVTLTETGLRAVSAQFGTVLVEAQETTLSCPGPDLLS